MSRALCCALPLRHGETVAVIGWSAAEAAVLEDFGVATTVLAATRGDDAQDAGAPPSPSLARLPTDDASVDHVMLNAVTAETRSIGPSEVARIVRPGGTVLVVARARSTRARGESSGPPRWTDRHLRSAGLSDVRSYGVRPTLQDARYLVPFDCPAALAWYVNSFVSAATFRSPFLSSALRVVPRSHALLGRFPPRTLRSLFPAVALQAVRPAR